MQIAILILSIIVGAWKAIKFFFLEGRNRKKEALDEIDKGNTDRDPGAILRGFNKLRRK